jgi:hypothetical protein
MAVHRGNRSSLSWYKKRGQLSSHKNVCTNQSKQLFNSYGFSLQYFDCYAPWPRSKTVARLPSSQSKSLPLLMAKMPTQRTTTLTSTGMKRRGWKSTTCPVTSSLLSSRAFALQYFSSHWTHPSSPQYGNIFIARVSLHLRSSC